MKAEGGAASLYIRDASRRAELLPKLKAYFSGVAGVARVYTNEEARSIGLPAETVSDQAPQLYLTAAPDYASSDGIDGLLMRTDVPRGQHGYLNTMSDMQALFIASGAAINRGFIWAQFPTCKSPRPSPKSSVSNSPAALLFLCSSPEITVIRKSRTKLF